MEKPQLTDQPILFSCILISDFTMKAGNEVISSGLIDITQQHNTPFPGHKEQRSNPHPSIVPLLLFYIYGVQLHLV